MLNQAHVNNHAFIAGCDEVGRGCLFGDVYAAAVILPENHTIQGLADSKKLSARQRNHLSDLIQEQAIAFAIATASVVEIDSLNILQASLLAMKRAILSLKIAPTHVYVDGLYAPKIALPCTCVVGGDSIVPSISAAAIIAKVARDAAMQLLDADYPSYGLAQHKGYGTALHRAAIEHYGLTPLHRKSFKIKA